MAQGNFFQSASQALGITGSSPMRGILSQLGMGRGFDQGSGLGSQLGDQVSGETDEQRRKRMRDQLQGGFGGQAAQDLFGGGLGGMGGLSY